MEEQTEYKSELAIIDIKPADLPALFVDGGTDPILARIEEEIKKHVPDLSTAKGRKDIASLAYKVAKCKTYIDTAGKDLIADRKKEISVVDAERKKWRDKCDELRDRARKPLDDWEAAEEARLKAEADAREKEERLEREKLEANLAKERAEREKKEAEERAEQEKLAAVEEEKRRAQAEKEAEAEATRRREADRTHKATINSAARDAIMSWGAEKELAQNIVRAISQGKIPHVKISY